MQAVREWLVLFFAWPNGGVWSNLLASPIVGTVVWLWARRRNAALHRAIAGLHRKVDAQHTEIVEQNAELTRMTATHHRAVRAHLGIPEEATAGDEPEPA